MTSDEIKKRFLEFFQNRGHSVIPSASLIPENDPSVLFTTAGMQPLVPFLMGENHPLGKRLVGIQKCVRTGDLEEIGDNRHFSFFQMMGNWSLGDYFKEEAIAWSYELLTNKISGFGLNPKRLYITVFEGDENAPKDEESFYIWKKLGIPEKRIYFLGAEDNWWSPGENGPCGPDTEMFYDLTENGLGELSKEQFLNAIEEENLVEIWNDVFMEYEKRDGKVVGKLTVKNVDTGAGLERLTAVMQGKKTAYDTDLFSGIMLIVEKLSKNIKNQRIIADHLRTSIFMIADGVIPSNTDRGYILRRLIRRATIKTDIKSIDFASISAIVSVVSDKYGDTYNNISQNREKIIQVFVEEIQKFEKTVKDGIKEFERITLNRTSISSAELFSLFSSYGLPIDIIEELAKEKTTSIDRNGFEKEMKKHQELSRLGAEQKFKGGLGDTSLMSIKYHTATHLLHQALRDVLGPHIEQKGSNITAERLRFDFSHPEKMTEEEKQKVETIVNDKIKIGLPVNKITLPKSEAEKIGALHFFGDKYGNEVNVYYVGNSLESAYSKEFCGGPHVDNIANLGTFKIIKEEAISQGVRRIKAVLE